MGKWDGLNRRKFPRVNYPCLVIIRNNEEQKDVMLCHTENVGSGGICVIAKKSIKMFSAVEVELDLLDFGNHVKCKGKVVWNIKRSPEAKTKPSCYDVGIEFEELRPSEQVRIDEVVGRLVKNRSDTSR